MKYGKWRHSRYRGSMVVAIDVDITKAYVFSKFRFIGNKKKKGR